MSDHEAASLIFVPGISTAPSITMVSGRGVGMDVVKTNIERIGGTVDVSTQRGVGTTILIRIPLTLAIMPALIVTSGGERYAIPQVNLLEVARVDRDACESLDRGARRHPHLSPARTTPSPGRARRRAG